MDNPDNPMARSLSRAEEERLYGDDVADAQRADFAIERCARPAHIIGSRVLYVLAALILIATVALLWGV